ncbi:hypothetical protein CRG98_032870, partial [Punica granatum]
MAAARMLQRRILSLFARPHCPYSLNTATETSSQRLLPSVNAFFSGSDFHGK